MVMPSDIVSIGKKLKLSGIADLPSLLQSAASALGLDPEGGAIDMSVANASPESDAAPVPVTSLDEVPAKCKVQFWPKGMYGAAAVAPAARKITMLIMTNEVFVHSHRVVAEASSVAELVATACAKLEGAANPADYYLRLEAGAEVVSFDDVPDKAKVSICLRDAPEAAEAAEAREFLLMVTVNDVVLNAKKLKISASDIDELYDKVAEGLDLDEPVFVCPVASSVHDAEPYGSLAEISDKAKVSVWPVRCFEEAEEDEAAPASRGISFAEDPPATTGVSFAEGTDGSGVTEGVDVRKSYASGEYGGLMPPEDLVAEHADPPPPRGISFADDTDGSGTTAGSSSLRKSYGAGEYGGLLPPEDLVAEDAAANAGQRELILMVTANEFVTNAKRVKVTVSNVDDLYDKIAEELQMDEPVFVCPVATSVDEAEPYDSLDALGDKEKVSVWPARVFAVLEEEEDDDHDGYSELHDEEGVTRSSPSSSPHRHNSGLPTITEIAVQCAELCQEMVDGKEKSFMGYTFICKAADEQRWTVTKRYSDFDRLKKALVSDVPEVKKWVLPRKTLPGKKDGDKTIQARKEGLAKFMASVVAVAGAHEAVQDFVTGEGSTYGANISGVGEVDPGTPAPLGGDMDASWSQSAGAMEEAGDPAALSAAATRMQDGEAFSSDGMRTSLDARESRMQDAEYGVGVVRMADASGMEVALESAIDMLTPLGLMSLKKVEEAADSETGVKAKKSYLKKKQQAKTAATEANEKAVRMAGYDETGAATMERLTELSIMRNKVKEAYGAQSPQYIAISKKCMIEMGKLKEREAQQKAEYKTEQEIMAAAEQAAAAPEDSLGAQMKANAEAMSQDFAASQSEQTGGGTGEDVMLGSDMNESALAAMGEIAAGMSLDSESRPLPSEPKNEYMLMVTANEFVPHPKKLRIEAGSLHELCDAVAEQLGLDEPVFLCCPSDDVDEAVPYASHDDIGAKAKVSVWPARYFGMDDDGDEDLAATMQRFEAEDAETEPAAQEEEEAEAGIPPASAEPAAAARDFLLMVTANDAVLNAKKLKISASDIDELYDKVAEGLDLNEPVFVCAVAASVGEALPYDSLDAIGGKAKVSVWPVRCFEEADAAEVALPEGSPPEQAVGEFGYDDEDTAFNAMMVEEAREAEEEEAWMAAQALAATEREEARRAEAVARVQAEEEARVAAAAKAEEEARAAAAAQAVWQAREAEQQAAAVAAEAEAGAAAAAAVEAEAAADAEAATEAEAAVKAAVASAAAAAEAEAEEEVAVETGEPDLAVARKFILMVVANDVIKPARLLRVEACSLGELRRKVSEGLDLGTNPVEVCPVAASVEAAVPYATLAEIKDKAKVSVWPCSSFGGGAPAPFARPSAPAPKPAAAAAAPTVGGGEPVAVSARELARQKALVRNAAVSPDARAAARERAKARRAAQQAS